MSTCSYYRCSSRCYGSRAYCYSHISDFYRNYRYVWFIFHMRINRTHCIFWGNSIFTPLTFNHDFEINNVKFKTLMHYITTMKLKSFGKFDQLNDTINETSTRILQSTYSNIDDGSNSTYTSTWNNNALNVITLGIYHQVSNSKYLKYMLLGLEGLKIVFADPRDREFGVGMRYNNYRIYDEEDWTIYNGQRSKNLIGYALELVRDRLLSIE